MDDFWGDIEREVMKSLEGRGATPVIEVARRLAISEEAAASLLSQLAREGKVRICAVESAAPRGQAA